MDRYEVSIKLIVNKKDGEGKPHAFFDSSMNYADLPYEGVVAIENLMVEMAGRLAKWGVEIAVAKGLEDKIVALGVNVK